MICSLPSAPERKALTEPAAITYSPLAGSPAMKRMPFGSRVFSTMRDASSSRTEVSNVPKSCVFLKISTRSSIDMDSTLPKCALPNRPNDPAGLSLRLEMVASGQNQMSLRTLFRVTCRLGRPSGSKVSRQSANSIKVVYSHPRPDAVGAFGKFGRGDRPLIFSTELARSTRDLVLSAVGPSIAEYGRTVAVY